MKQQHITFFLISFIATVNLFANTALLLDDSTDCYAAGGLLRIYQDSSATLPVDSIIHLRRTTAFKHVEQQIQNLGFSKAANWFSLDLCDVSQEKRSWIVDIAMPCLQNVDFYIVHADSVVSHYRSGLLIDKYTRPLPFRNPAIEFNGIPGETYTILACVKSETPVILPVFIREKNHYMAYARFMDFFLGLFYGVLFIMAVYNFYLFLSMANRGYLLLTFFIICYGAGQIMAVFGFLADWGITNLHAWLRWMHCANFLAAFFAFSLSWYFLRVKQFVPWCNTVFKVVFVILLVLVPLSAVLSFRLAEQILVLSKLLPLPFLFWAGIVACSKGYRPAVHFLFAASFYIGGVMVFNLMYGFNLFPYHEFLYFLPYIALGITLTLFSFGLAYSINGIRKEREEAREQALFDLNAKMRIQEEKAAMERELEHSRKMETVGRLLSGVAHDMNNFLVPVLGYAKLIRNECKLNDRLCNQSEQLMNAATRIKELSNTLVDVSRKRPMELRVVNLNAVINQIGSLLKHSAPVGKVIRVEPSVEKPTVLADEGMVHSALLNVGINAVDALPDGGGTVVVTSGCGELHAGHPALRRTGNTPGLYAWVTIEDNGIGMTEDVQARIFEPFFTTKSDGKGTGLGLVGVYNCMMTHHGCINLRSVPGEGTCMTLYFPAAEYTPD